MTVGVDQRRLLAVYAHPDDESFGSGGTLALYASRGVAVSLVCATRGEVGEIADPTLSSLRIGGRFKVGDLEEIFEVLESNFGISVNRLSKTHVQLNPQQEI